MIDIIPDRSRSVKILYLLMEYHRVLWFNCLQAVEQEIENAVEICKCGYHQIWHQARHLTDAKLGMPIQKKRF